MCGFVVSTNKKDEKKILEGFKKIQYRGPDQTRKIEVDNNLFCFHRLAIMGLNEKGMQPFEKNYATLVCNGEIYNYRFEKDKMLKKGITFESESDCEILLPLYNEYGVDMFEKLDAEFALVLYDKKSKKIIAGRDPIGIRPLFYGYLRESKDIIFSSEVKAINDLCSEVYPFPPGHYYIDGKFVKYCDLTDVKEVRNDSLDEIFKNINNKLTKGVIKRLDSDAPLGFLLSGGLDSSLVCSIAARHLNKPIKTFAVGMDIDAIDLKYARQVADYIGSEHTEVIITKDDVIKCLREVIYNLETWDITTIRASIGMYLLCKWIRKNTDIRVLLTGEVSDELFGYKYTDFAPSPEEFQKESQKRMRELYMYDVLRADRCISANALEGRVPFADLDFVDYTMRIDPKKKMNTYNKGKYLLRHAFEGLNYLPHDILFREKAAFSDAVGHSMVDYLKEYADSLYTDEDVKNAKDKYPYCTPFTKESLLYRDIFESYYPGKAKWIKDFWMPNKTWENCDVNDPSARVLKNYGDSGK